MPESLVDIDKIRSKILLLNITTFDLLDTKKLSNSEYTEDETGGRITFNPLEEEPLFEDIIKNDLGKSEFYIPS